MTTKLETWIAAWNVQTRHHVGQNEIIALELLKCKNLIAAVSELYLTGSWTLTIHPPTTDETMTLFYSGGGKQEALWLALWWADAVGRVIAFQSILDRLAVLTIVGTVKIHILSPYAPIETSLDTAKYDFYN